MSLSIVISEMEPEQKLELAAWYRAKAEQASAPHIWDARIRTAELLEEAAGIFTRTGNVVPMRAATTGTPAISIKPGSELAAD